MLWGYNTAEDITYIYVAAANKYYQAVRSVKRLLGRKAAAELRTKTLRTRCLIKINM